MMSEAKKTVVFDFDGVIHSYKSGWKGASVIHDPPVDGMPDAIRTIRKRGYEVVVVSTRTATEDGINAVKSWLDKYGITVDRICSEKPPAYVYIDDRAIRFDGNALTMLSKIDSFKTWMEASDDEETTLVNALRDDAEWARANEWETPITLSDNLDKAADLIESLAAELEQVKQERDGLNILLAQAQSMLETRTCERDAAVEDISKECHKCKHFKVMFNGCTHDYDCEYSDVCEDGDHWQWRGVEE